MVLRGRFTVRWVATHIALWAERRGPDRSLVIAVAPASAQPDLSVTCVILFGYLERR